MSAYCFFNIREVKDSKQLDAYSSKVLATVHKYHGRYLVVGGSCEQIEGEWKPTIPVLIEFHNVAQAKAWYNSDDYSEIKTLRLEATVGDMVIIESETHPFVTAG